MTTQKPIQDELLIARPPDEYERTFMGPDEHVLVRDKMNIHPAFHVFMAAAIITGLVGVIAASGSLIAPIAVLLFGLLVWSSAATLRTTVSAENLHIQYGVLGPTVPIESIESAKAIKYSFMKYGGWGIRYSVFDNSWCYNMIGDGGHAVEVLYRKNGKLKKLLVASKASELLADTINRAREGKIVDEVVLDFDVETAETRADVQQQTSTKASKS